MKTCLTHYQWMTVWEYGCLYQVMVINWKTGNIERRIFTGQQIKQSFRKHWLQLIKPAELSSDLARVNKNVSVSVSIVDGAWSKI